MMLIQKPELGPYEESLQSDLCAMFKAMARMQAYLFQQSLVTLKQQGTQQPFEAEADESAGRES
jgi:hypothetical protein